jgi:hypothetical protein
VSPRNKYEPVTAAQSTTTTVMSSSQPIDIATTAQVEHSTERIDSTESSSLAMTTEGNVTNDTSTLIASTMIYVEETTRGQEETTPRAAEVDYMTTGQMSTETTAESTSQPATVTEAETSTASHPPRLIHVLTNSSHSAVTEEPFPPATTADRTTGKRTANFTFEAFFSSHLIAFSTSVNPCTLENLRANFVYHEYAPDNHKFIFCDSEGKMNIIACSPNYVWSQSEQSCILPA